MSKATDLGRQVAEKREELMAIFTKAKKDDTYDLTASEIEEIRNRNHELDELSKAWEEAREIERIAEANERELKSLEQLKPLPPLSSSHDRYVTSTSAKTIGELFVESKEFKLFGRGGPQGWPQPATFDVDLKTTFSTGAGWAPDVTRTGKVVLSAQRPPTLIDTIPWTETSQSSVQYMEETTFTNAAAETAEAGAYPEAALALTERTVPVRKIAVHLPTTDEQLDDVPRVRDYIDNRLMLMLQQRLNTQVVTGDNSAPNLDGILRSGRGIQTQAKGTDPVLDAIFKAITKVRHTGFAEPSAIWMNPNDWQDIRLTKNTGGDLYVFGNPADPGPERIFGIPVVINGAVTENTAIVGDFAMYSELSYRKGVDIQVGFNADDFTKGKKTVRADFRVAFILYRLYAFCSVTGI